MTEIDQVQLGVRQRWVIAMQKKNQLPTTLPITQGCSQGFSLVTTLNPNYSAPSKNKIFRNFF